jgi:hypothetical protein
MEKPAGLLSLQQLIFYAIKRYEMEVVAGLGREQTFESTLRMIASVSDWVDNSTTFSSESVLPFGMTAALTVLDVPWTDGTGLPMVGDLRRKVIYALRGSPGP